MHDIKSYWRNNDMDIESLAEPGEVIPWYAYLASKLAPVTEEDIEWAKNCMK